MKRAQILNCTLIVIMVVLFWGTASVRSEKTALVKTVPIGIRAFSKTITTYGITQPDSSSITSINLPRAGIINRLWIRPGQLVEPNAPLLEFETAANASRDYQQAQAAANFARNALAREEQLFGSQLTTRQKVANARKNLADAEAQLEAQRKLGTSQSAQTVNAPFAGVVIKLNVNEGDLVQAGANVMMLARRDALVVLLGIEPEEANKVHKGMLVTLSSVFEPSVTFNATVNQVHGMINPATRLVDVLVNLNLPADNELPLGLTMKGMIILSVTQSLGVPRSAVLSDQGVSFIFVVREGKAHKVPVETGDQDAGFIPINGKVKVGDEVVVLGNYELEDGMAINKEAQ